ncbi:trimeric intracellular cation channel family protein [Streptomyces sp. 8N706]|uniref:trimeric intracellular cation channel family protein n=1 Tax=Streptomyces sp. 8N706 TaxID=3457416 RepID=UPI003FD42F50
MHELTAPAQYFLDLLGIYGFALSGAFLGVRKDFNLFGTVVVAEAAGLGGGLVRDLVLDVPAIAFTDPGYPLAALAAALIAYLGRPLRRQPYLLDVLDAVGLGLFSVTGTIKALQHGMEAVPSAALGVTTAMGGGILASVVAKELPPLVRWDSDLYATPAMTGAGGVSALHAAGALNVTTAAGAALTAFTFRLLAVRFHWRLIRSATWQTGFSQPTLLPDTAPRRTPSSATACADTLRLRAVGVPSSRTTQLPRGPIRLPDTLPAVQTGPAGASRPGAIDPRLRMTLHGSESPQTPDVSGHGIPPRPAS